MNMGDGFCGCVIRTIKVQIVRVRGSFCKKINGRDTDARGDEFEKRTAMGRSWA